MTTCPHCLQRDRRRLAAQAAMEKLSPRQKEAIIGLALGETGKETGARLHLSSKTAWYHLWRACEKCGVSVHQKARLIKLAWRAGLVSCLCLICVAGHRPLRSPKGVDTFPNSGAVPVMAKPLSAMMPTLFTIPPPKSLSLKLAWDYSFLDPQVWGFAAYWWTNGGANVRQQFAGKVLTGTVTNLPARVPSNIYVTALGTNLESDPSATIHWPTWQTNRAFIVQGWLKVGAAYVPTNLYCATKLDGVFYRTNSTLGFTNSMGPKTLFIRPAGPACWLTQQQLQW